jgi:hypothetical protein
LGAGFLVSCRGLSRETAVFVFVEIFFCFTVALASTILFWWEGFMTSSLPGFSRKAAVFFFVKIS